MSDEVEIKIEIGTSAEELGRRFVEAWHAAERGEVSKPQRILVVDGSEIPFALCGYKIKLGCDLAPRVDWDGDFGND